MKNIQNKFNIVYVNKIPAKRKTRINVDLKLIVYFVVFIIYNIKHHLNLKKSFPLKCYKIIFNKNPYSM